MFVECKLCKKELKSKISKERGYGPECWQKHLADMPKKSKPLEGAISFSIEDDQYPELHQKSKIKNVATERKMICVFPSSLHHFTRPFSGEGRRLSFAFDLLSV